MSLATPILYNLIYLKFPLLAIRYWTTKWGWINRKPTAILLVNPITPHFVAAYVGNPGNEPMPKIKKGTIIYLYKFMYKMFPIISFNLLLGNIMKWAFLYQALLRCLWTRQVIGQPSDLDHFPGRKKFTCLPLKRHWQLCLHFHLCPSSCYRQRCKSCLSTLSKIEFKVFIFMRTCLFFCNTKLAQLNWPVAI